MWFSKGLEANKKEVLNVRFEARRLHLGKDMHFRKHKSCNLVFQQKEEGAQICGSHISRYRKTCFGNSKVVNYRNRRKAPDFRRGDISRIFAWYYVG